MPNEQQELPIENPDVVKGGPFDPTNNQEQSKESPKGDPNTPKPLYKGLTGDITTADDLVKYTSNLETMLAASRKPEAPTQSPFTHNSSPAPVNGATNEKWEDLIYSDAAKAKQLLFNEWEASQQQKEQRKEQEKRFWKNFYDKNPDLKEHEHVVQSVFKRDLGDVIQTLPSDEAVAIHLGKESRSIVDHVKSKLGIKETTLSSRSAVIVGSHGEPGSASQAASNNKPLNFFEQVQRLKRKKA